MKRIILLIVLLSMATCLFAQYEFTASVQNQSASGTDFTFDVYMVRTGGSDIYLGDSDFAFTFNNANFTNPVASVVAVPGRIWDWYSISATVVAPNIIVLNIGKPTWNDQSQFDSRVQVISTSGNGTLIGRVKITNITNPNGTMGLAWRNSGGNSTKVNRLDNADPWAQHSISANGTFSGISDSSLPVELVSFTAQANGKSVILEWSTESETDNLGFVVERSIDEKNRQTISSYRTNSELKGQGTATNRTDYVYTDNSTEPGKEYSYRLSDVSSNGATNILGSLKINVEALPETTCMDNAYPNPFNPQTAITYHLAQDGEVNIDIFDLLGRKVISLVSGKQAAGSYKIQWAGQNSSGEVVPSGTYLIRMRSNSYHQIQKVTLVK